MTGWRFCGRFWGFLRRCGAVDAGEFGGTDGGGAGDWHGGGGKRGAAAQPLRVAISGGTITPPLLETLVLLGREKTVGRIERMRNAEC